jgi:hypothetical protein
MKWLIGTLYGFFYTGKPPNVIGGSYPLLRFIGTYKVWRREPPLPSHPAHPTMPGTGSLLACQRRNCLKLRPSRPEDLHPEPLTDSGRKPLDLSGSCHPLKAAAFHRDRRVPPVSPLTLLIATRVTCSLRSSGITPSPRYYGAVRPWVAHRYFRTRGSSTCAFSLSIASQVLKFRTKARTRFTPPLHRTPHSQ